MQSRFTIDGGIVHFGRIDLSSDGSRSAVTGDVDLAHWPEQTYQINSNIDFPTQKNIFFHGQKFTASGQGDFTGTFHLFKGGRELKGTFTSPLAGVNAWRFPNLRGSVLWLPDRLEITNATAELYGGTARFDYRMAPFGKPGVPTRATWDVDYRDVDLSRLTDFLETKGLRLAGSATGQEPARMAARQVGARSAAAARSPLQPPPGVAHDDARAPARRHRAGAPICRSRPARSTPHLSLGYLPVAGHIVYALDPEWIIARRQLGRDREHLRASSRDAPRSASDSRIPFHVTSLDWQESDRVLAGIMTTFGAPTGAVPIGGNGEFDGVMLASFSKPRIEGTFTGDRMRAWDVVWGTGIADVVIENSYAIVANAS